MMRLFLKRYLFCLLVLFLTACGGGGGGGGGGTVVPPVPRGITVVPGNGKVTISWIDSGNTYNIYMGSSTPVTKKKHEMSHAATSSPFTLPHSLLNDKALFFVLTAVGPADESNESIEVSTTPRASAVVSPTAITAGSDHTCAILADKTIKCWGANGSGQTGTIASTFSKPDYVAGILASTVITAGGSHTCAILTDNTVKCWGANESGQLGIDLTTTATSTPTSVSGIATSTAITAGEAHTCAIFLGGTVKCWGKNTDGQLGNAVPLLDDDAMPPIPAPGPSSTPVSVSGITSVKAIVAGNDHVCAILSDDTVKCWGANESGQLGIDLTTTATSTPTSVSGSLTAKKIVAGRAHTCAIIGGDTVKCWGANESGQLGNENTSASPVPVPVSGVTNVKDIAAGADHTCVILLDGTVKCWGGNSTGQLGDGSATDRFSKSSLPVKAIGVTRAIAIDAGLSHTCAILDSGIVVCWGNNPTFQLGANNNNSFDTSSSVLVQVEGIP